MLAGGRILELEKLSITRRFTGSLTRPVNFSFGNEKKGETMLMRQYAPHVACLLAMWSSVPPAHAFDNHDWQFWTTEAVEYKITDQWNAKMDAQFYFGDDMSDLFYRHADIGISRKVAPWLGIGVNYRFIEQKKNDEWKQESRPHINGTFYWRTGGLRFSDRNRLEYRIREDAHDFWRYRNRLRVGLPLQWSRLNIEPYVSYEVFIDSEQEEVNGNRASVGVGSSFLEHFKLELYYMFQSEKKDVGWTDANILGTNLSLSF